MHLPFSCRPGEVVIVQSMSEYQETMRVVFPFYSKPEHFPVPLIQFLKLAMG